MDARNIAQSFSASLNETFDIENNPRLEGLLQSVEEKYALRLMVVSVNPTLTNCPFVLY